MHKNFLKIDDRVQQFHEAEAFITVKDHKDTFTNFLTFRLINPSKSEIGKISKSILDKINNAFVEKTKVNQWKNSANTIKWFKSTPNKKEPSFVIILSYGRNCIVKCSCPLNS